MVKVYLASPYGFAYSTSGFLKELRGVLRDEGWEVLDPWEFGEPMVKEFQMQSANLSDEARVSRLRKLNDEIGNLNREALDTADIVVAGLDGPDVDSGTASEIGYAYARGKIIVGYRGDFRLTGENEAAMINIQVQYWIERSGGRIVRTLLNLLSALSSIQNSQREWRHDGLDVSGVQHK
ncbi:nucleoside 2-deoxyribosyltransferase [Nitrososphaera sp.]|uniref:nucleoside 2-deoxyribosyltransferase n=1 Tax=Nitrososphaera sp. TaxID=1971748 RepID=UPI002EDA1815